MLIKINLAVICSSEWLRRHTESNAVILEIFTASFNASQSSLVLT